MSGLEVSLHERDEDGKEPYFMRMTPMEVDIQLQAAEIIFRSILEGRRLHVTYPRDIDEWHREVLGEAWLESNRRQRCEILRQMKEDGENTPMWMEALAHMGDIAWEVFQAGDRGEMVLALQDVNRDELIEQFKELHPKIRDSYYARCGAGDQLYSLRACIAVLRIFIHDAEILDHCAETLYLVIHDNQYNRDGLTELSLPMPPLQRTADTPERGWSFLRACLEAFMVQSGGGASRETPMSESNLVVAIKLARCIVVASSAPALTAQLALLREEVPENACAERWELTKMREPACAHTKQLLESNPDPVLEQFLHILSD